MDWETRLITLYVFICEQFQKDLWLHCQRFTNNARPRFTDEEVITVFLFGIMQRRFELKSCYGYAVDHLSDWFPDMPSYQAFVARLNRISVVFPVLVERIVSNFPEIDSRFRIRLIDSFPLVMAQGKRSSKARVAKEFANKGYCASKCFWYYGVKIHVLGLKREKRLPIPEFIGLTPASEHDLSAFRQISPTLENCDIYADLAYLDELEKQLLKEQDSEILTPVKKKKGQKSLEMFDALFSTTVSRMRQPIESLFNWIQEKTNIQMASKVRSYEGLMVHAFGRLAAAMFILAFNS